jgi:hypothetical protein
VETVEGAGGGSAFADSGARFDERWGGWDGGGGHDGGGGGRRGDEGGREGGVVVGIASDFGYGLEELKEGGEGLCWRIWLRMDGTRLQ